MRIKNSNSIRNLVLSAMLLALAIVLPFFTGQIQQIGNALCPMHLPVLLCGFLCGPLYAVAVGLMAPLLRFAMFGMPPLMPIGIAMCFELATYGLAAGVLYQKLPKKKSSIFVALITAMVIGRVVWGLVSALLYGVSGAEFGITIFLTQAFANAIPGIIAQIVLIPIIVSRFNK